MEDAADREKAQTLAAQADVLVESYRPGEAERLGVDYETLSAINPRLIYCSISGFGRSGPLSNVKGYEGVIAARSGRRHNFAGQLDREGPAYVAVQTGTWAASQGAVRGILASLRARARAGRGQRVDTSVLQGMIPYYGGRQLSTYFTRIDPEQFPNTLPGPRTLPNLGYIPVRTGDGRWLQHANIQFSPRLLHAHLRAIGLGWVLEDDRFKNTSALTPENQEALRELILERMQEKTMDEWMEIYVEDGDIAGEPFLHTVEAMNHPQFVHNRHVVEIDDPRVGPMKVVGVLADLANNPGEVGGPAPDLGQHTQEVLAELAGRETALVAGASSNGSHPMPTHPLEDVTVLDFSTVIAGPYGAVMIADLGARVIKVDAVPGRGMPGVGAVNLNNIRTYSGKECIRVDLQTEEGRELVHKLVARADVLLHNFRPGVPDRLGIDYETCRQINPRLVHVYVGAYGATGPHSRRPGAHPIPGALFGGALRQAGRATPPPTYQPMNMDEVKDMSRRMMRANEGNPDPNSSQAVGTAIMLGLWDRDRTGQGQSIQVTMMCANAWANHDEAYDYNGRPTLRSARRRLLRPPRPLQDLRGKRRLGVPGLPIRGGVAGALQCHRPGRPHRRPPVRTGGPHRPRRRARRAAGRSLRHAHGRGVGTAADRRGRGLRPRELQRERRVLHGRPARAGARAGRGGGGREPALWEVPAKRQHRSLLRDGLQLPVGPVPRPAHPRHHGRDRLQRAGG